MNKGLHVKTNTRSIISIFVPTLAGGGAERIMLNLAKEFAGADHPVDLVVATPKGEYTREVPPTVRLVDLGTRRMSLSIMPLARYLRSRKPAALLSTMTHGNLIAILAKLLARTSTRIVVREATTLSISARNSGKIREYAFPFLVRILYPFADHVVAVSNGVAQDLTDVVHLRIPQLSVIYNPVCIQGLGVKASEPVTHPWFQGEGAPILLAVGRLTAAKDYPTLFRALKILKKTREARLVILGEGEERQALEKLAAELGLAADISMPGFDFNPSRYMRRAAVFVLSSRWEGLPNALIEAVACGKQVVATDCRSGPREILNGNPYGSLVPVGDEHAMAGAIAFALDNPPAQEAFGVCANRFDSEIISRQYLNILLNSQLCDEHR